MPEIIKPFLFKNLSNKLTAFMGEDYLNIPQAPGFPLSFSFNVSSPTITFAKLVEEREGLV